MVLKAYWPLDEESGSTAYDVRNGNNGSVNGATQGANGILGSSAYEFDGRDYVSIFHPSLPVTVTCWANSNVTDGSNDQVVSLLDTDSYSIALRNINNNWNCSYGAGSITGPAVKTGEWVMLTAMWDGTTFKFYHNDVLQGTASSLGTSSSTVLDAIGGDYDNGNQFNGKIQHVRIYDHALTAQEVQYLYQVGSRGLHVSDRRGL